MKRTPDPRSGRTIAAQDAPIEYAQLFEAASMEAIRVPATGGFPDFNKALGSMMALGRMRAAMKRSPHTPKAFRSLISAIEFTRPLQDEQGWHYLVRPMSDGSTVSMLRSIVPPLSDAHDFWKEYADEAK